MARKISKMKAAQGTEKPLQGVVDDGTREIPIVNKFGKLICNVYIRPSDLSIIDRYQDLVKDFDRIVKPLESLDIKNDGTASFDEDWKILKSVETDLKQRIDELFDMEEADEIFAKRNPFSSIGGEFFCAKVLKALENVIVAAINEEAQLSNERTAKYLSNVPESSGVNADAGDTADNA